MDLEDLLLPQELKLDDKDVIWNVDFCRFIHASIHVVEKAP